jgi:hypothetical protein
MDFEMRRGDTPTVVGYLRDENGALVNDPTAQYKLTARASRSSTASVIFEVGPVTQHAAGEGWCPIPTFATSGFTRDRILYYDMQCVESGGTTTTILEGRITVKVDMAR